MIEGVEAVPRADKKQRQKAKRAAKRHEARRRESVSPVKRLAGAIGEIEYWMSEGFEENGQAQIFVYKRAAGLCGVACFLVDEGVVGLKDAWTRMNVDRIEFTEMLEASRYRGVAMSQVTLEEVRKLIAGGIRWAHENGMRLPKDWTKTASLIGGVGDWASADVSKFVREFAGHPNDLRQRLIGEPFETYIQRKDVEFIFTTSAPYLDQGTGEYVAEGETDDEDENDVDEIVGDLSAEEMQALAERFAPSVTGLVKETSEWLASRGKSASPELFEAWQSIMLAAMISKAAVPDGPEKEIADFGYELLETMSGRIEAFRSVEYRKAVGQVLQHLQTDALMMQKAVLKYGLANEPSEEREEE